jgi:hypothetical protein
MPETISLADERDRRKPAEVHLEGPALCLVCDHRWEAVVPPGTVWLECPSCRTEKGVFTGPCYPHEGGYLWRCNCGCELFQITPSALRCYHCGLAAEGYA